MLVAGYVQEIFVLTQLYDASEHWLELASQLSSLALIYIGLTSLAFICPAGMIGVWFWHLHASLNVGVGSLWWLWWFVFVALLVEAADADEVALDEVALAEVTLDEAALVVTAFSADRNGEAATAVAKIRSVKRIVIDCRDTKETSRHGLTKKNATRQICSQRKNLGGSGV